MFSPNLLYGMVLLAFTSPNMPDTAEEHNFGWHPGHSITGAPNLLALTAEQVQPPAPEKKQSAVSGGAVPFVDLGKMGGLPGGAEGTKK